MQTKTQENITQSKSNSKPFIAPVPVIQKKLEIGASDDKYEIEADRMADQVVQMKPIAGDKPKPTNTVIQRKCSNCEEEEHIQKKSLLEQITPLVQRRSSRASEGSVASDKVSAKINQSNGGGSVLDKRTKKTMETGFGSDFSNVRIHTDNNATYLSKSLNAQAFTVGNDVFFNEGKFNPNSSSGKHLLAHELTHVVQQSTRQTICSSGKKYKDKISNYNGISNAVTAPTIQRKFIGTDKKNVKMEKGVKAKHILITSNNASSDLIELIRLVNKSGSEAAIDQVLKASHNASEIHVKIERRRIKNGKYGLHQAHDKSGKALKWNSEKGDFDGIPEYASDGVYKSATITIYMGNLEKGGGNPSSHDSAGIKLTLEQLVAGTFSHETGHNTDKEFIDDLRKRREGKRNKGIDAHDNIDPLDNKVYKEMGEHAYPQTFSNQTIEELKNISISNAKLPKKENAKEGEAFRQNCIKLVHSLSEKIFIGTAKDKAELLSALKKIRVKGSTYTMEHTSNELVKLNHAMMLQKVKFSRDEKKESISDVEVKDKALKRKQRLEKTIVYALVKKNLTQVELIKARIELNEARKISKKQINEASKKVNKILKKLKKESIKLKKAIENVKLVGGFNSESIRAIKKIVGKKRVGDIKEQKKEIKKEIEKEFGDIFSEEKMTEIEKAITKELTGAPKRMKVKNEAWNLIMGMVGNNYGWHIYGMAIADGYHSVSVIVDNQPDYQNLYLIDQWPFDILKLEGENELLGEPDSVPGFRRYEKDKFSAYLNHYTREFWWRVRKPDSNCRNPKGKRRTKWEGSCNYNSELIIWKYFSQKIKPEQKKLFKKQLKSLKEKIALGQIDFPNKPKKPKKPEKLGVKTQKTSPMTPKPDSDPQFGLNVGSHLRFPSGEETSAELALKFKYYLPLLLETKWRPFIYGGVHADTDKKIGGSGGIGAQSDHFADMSLFLAGYTGLRTPTFNAVEYGGGLEAAWEFNKTHSLRLGVEWKTWIQMGDTDKRTHILGLTIGKPF